MSIFGGSTLLGGASFYAAEAESHMAIQAELAEAFVYRPMKSPSVNEQQVPDPSRPVQSVTAIFEWEAREINLRTDHLKVASRTPCLMLHTCTLYHLRRRDVFERCVDGSLFEVRVINRDGLSGIKVEMIQLGIQD